MMDCKKTDIVTINFNPTKGHEIGKIRPALVISGDDENSILDTLIVMPLSTHLIDDMVPFRMRICQRENLKQDSDILINHIRTISKKRVGEKIASLNADEFNLVIENLCKNFT